jgi:hypothetical protein
MAQVGRPMEVTGRRILIRGRTWPSSFERLSALPPSINHSATVKQAEQVEAVGERARAVAPRAPNRFGDSTSSGRAFCVSAVRTGWGRAGGLVLRNWLWRQGGRQWRYEGWPTRDIGQAGKVRHVEARPATGNQHISTRKRTRQREARMEGGARPLLLVSFVYDSTQLRPSG